MQTEAIAKDIGRLTTELELATLAIGHSNLEFRLSPIHYAHSLTVSGRIGQKDWTFRYSLEEDNVILEITHSEDLVSIAISRNPTQEKPDINADLLYASLNLKPFLLSAEYRKQLEKLNAATTEMKTVTDRLKSISGNPTETRHTSASVDSQRKETEDKLISVGRLFNFVDSYLRNAVPDFFVIADRYFTGYYCPEVKSANPKLETPLEVLALITVAPIDTNTQQMAPKLQISAGHEKAKQIEQLRLKMEAAKLNWEQDSLEFKVVEYKDAISVTGDMLGKGWSFKYVLYLNKRELYLYTQGDKILILYGKTGNVKKVKVNSEDVTDRRIREKFTSPVLGQVEQYIRDVAPRFFDVSSAYFSGSYNPCNRTSQKPIDVAEILARIN